MVDRDLEHDALPHSEASAAGGAQARLRSDRLVPVTSLAAAF